MMKGRIPFLSGLFIGILLCGSFAVLRAQPVVGLQPVSGEVNRYQTCTGPNGTYLTDTTNGKIWVLNPGPPIRDGKFTWTWDLQAQPVNK